MPGFPFVLHLGENVALTTAQLADVTYNNEPVNLHGVAINLVPDRTGGAGSAGDGSPQFRTLSINAPHAGESYRCRLKDAAFQAGLIFSGIHIPGEFAATASIVTARHGTIFLRPVPTQLVHVLPESLPIKPGAAASAGSCRRARTVELLRRTVKEISGAPMILVDEIQEVHVGCVARDGVDTFLDCTRMAVVASALRFTTAAGKLESAAILPDPSAARWVLTKEVAAVPETSSDGRPATGAVRNELASKGQWADGKVTEYLRRLSDEQQRGFSRVILTRADVPLKPAAMTLPPATDVIVTEMVLGSRDSIVPPHSISAEADTKRVPDRPPGPKPLPEPKMMLHPLPYRLTEGSERLRLLERAREPGVAVLMTNRSVVVVDASSRRAAEIKLRGSFSSGQETDPVARYFSLGQLEEGAAAVPIFDPDSPTDFPQFAVVCKKPDPRDPGAEGASHVPSGSHRYYVYYVVLINASGDLRPVQSSPNRMEISCDVPHKLVVRNGSAVEVGDLGAGALQFLRERQWTLRARIQGEPERTALDSYQSSPSRLLVLWSGPRGKNTITEYTIPSGSGSGAAPTGRFWTSYMPSLGDAAIPERAGEGGQEKSARRRVITLMTKPAHHADDLGEEDEPLLRFLDAETMEDVDASMVAGSLDGQRGPNGRGKFWTEETEYGAFLLFEDDGSEQGGRLPRLVM
jgi:hypothetical protein